MIEETENQEQSLEELIERVEQDDLPTNEFTIEDTDPMVLLGKINEVIGYLRTLQGTIETSDTKATQALESAITALESANSALTASTTALSNANAAIRTSLQAISSANSAVETANSASTTANDAESKATEAKETAEGIAGTANQALSTAQNANTTANNASTTANNANTTANTANNTANSANEAANIAYTTAQQALNTAQGKQAQLTQTQLDAVNSGITSALVGQINTNTTDIAGKQAQLSQTQLDAVNSGINATKCTMFETTSYKGRAELYGINADMNIGVNDTPVINLRERRNNPKINYTLNNTSDGIIVPAGVRQVKVTSIMSYLPKSNNESFNNVIKINGNDVPDYQGFIYVQAPIANVRTSLCNIVVINVSEGDVISFVTKAPLTDVNNPAVLQRFNTHFIIETLQTNEEG